MNEASTDRYDNYFVYPHTDSSHPDWLTPFELPVVSKRLSDAEVAVISATLVALLPEPPAQSEWRSTGRRKAVRRFNA